MMQIHVNAIEKSRVADIQYVLRKGFDMACVSNEQQLLEYLKDGWEIAGKYSNGVGYNKYKTTDEREIFCIKNFIEKELHGYEFKLVASTVTISFLEYFEPITCELKKIVALIVFSVPFNRRFKHYSYPFENENAKKIKNFLIFDLNMKQDKANVIDLIEKKMARKD